MFKHAVPKSSSSCCSSSPAEFFLFKHIIIIIIIMFYQKFVSDEELCPGHFGVFLAIRNTWKHKPTDVRSGKTQTCICTAVYSSNTRITT